MGKSKTTNKTVESRTGTQSATPFAPILPGMNELGTAINGAMTQAIAMPSYSGDFTALPGDLQRGVAGGYSAVADTARGMAPQMLDMANRATTQLPSFGGPSLEQGTQSFGSYDPSGVDSVVQAAIQPYIRQLTEQVLPGIQSSAIESGAYSNDRAFAMLPQMALRDTGRMASEVAAGIGFQDFMSQQQRQQNAYQMGTQRGLGEADVLTQRMSMYPELMGTALQMQTGAADMDAQAAAYDTALRQSEINNAIARHQYGVEAPYEGMGTAAQLFGTFAPYATQNSTSNGTSTNTVTQQQSPIGQALQGALGIASMVGGIPGAGSAIGGLLGLGSTAAGALAPVGAASQIFAQPVFKPQITPTYRP